MDKELIEYYWNEITECGEFVYEYQDGRTETATVLQALKVETPSKEHYWSQMLWFLNTQGEL